MGEQLGVDVLYLLSLETNLVLPVHRIDVILDVLKLLLGYSEDDHGHVLPADGALVLLTENPHPGAAHQTYRMVALADAEHGHLVHADLAVGVHVLRLAVLPLTTRLITRALVLTDRFPLGLPAATSRLFIAICITSGRHFCSEMKNYTLHVGVTIRG